MKRVLVIILLIAILCTSIFVFLGCTPNIDTTKTTCEHGRDLNTDGGRCHQCYPLVSPMSIDEIEEYVKGKYFKYNDTMKREFWEHKTLTRPDVEIPDRVTIGEIQFLKNVDENEDYYLVELEPYGHILGARNQAWVNFSVDQSYYKMLQVPNDNRYLFRLDQVNLIMMKKYNGYLVDLYYDYCAINPTAEYYDGKDPVLYTQYYNPNAQYYREWILRSELELEGGTKDEQ